MQSTGGEDVLLQVLFGSVIAVLGFLGSLSRSAKEIERDRLPPWSGDDPLPTPFRCPTSTKIEKAHGGLQLVTLDNGWAMGHGTTYAWTVGVRQPPGSMGGVQLRVVLVNRHDEHLPAGDGMGNFFSDSRQTRPEEVEDLLAPLRERLDPGDAGALTWITAMAPIHRLPGGKPGSLKRARARLEITQGEGRHLVATTPFAYVPRFAPEDRIAFMDSEATETTCPVCGDELAGRENKTCKRCGTPHHVDCYAYLGECAIFGCHA